MHTCQDACFLLFQTFLSSGITVLTVESANWQTKEVVLAVQVSGIMKPLFVNYIN